MRKIVGNLEDKLQKLYMNETVDLEIFSLPQAIENSRQFLLLRTDILQKTVIGCPLHKSKVKARRWLGAAIQWFTGQLRGRCEIGLFTAVLAKRLYKTHTPCIHYHLRDNTLRSHHGLIINVLVKLLAFTASFLPPVFISIFSVFWAMFVVSISFCNLGFIGCHVFDIRSGHIHFQGLFAVFS